MSDTNNDSFRTEMIAEIKRIQSELNELKDIKKSMTRKPARKTTAKKKVAKRKPDRKTTAKKKVAKRKPARKTSKPKRKTTRRR